jgi:hypothetical protein
MYQPLHQVAADETTGPGDQDPGTSKFGHEIDTPSFALSFKIMRGALLTVALLASSILVN